MKYYIITENDKNDSFYGILQTLDNKPFQIYSGKISGTDNEAINNITQMILKNIEKQEILKIRKNIYFKYQDLQSAKYMEYAFQHNKIYIDYSNKTGVNLFSNPSVFLSDVENVKSAKTSLLRYKNTYTYYQQHISGKQI